MRVGCRQSEGDQLHGNSFQVDADDQLGVLSTRESQELQGATPPPSAVMWVRAEGMGGSGGPRPGCRATRMSSASVYLCGR